MKTLFQRKQINSFVLLVSLFRDSFQENTEKFENLGMK